MARLSAAPIRLACRPMRYAHTAFVLALAHVTTRAYSSLAPAIAVRYAGEHLSGFEDFGLFDGDGAHHHAPSVTSSHHHADAAPRWSAVTEDITISDVPSGGSAYAHVPGNQIAPLWGALGCVALQRGDE